MKWVKKNLGRRGWVDAVGLEVLADKDGKWTRDTVRTGEDGKPIQATLPIERKVFEDGPTFETVKLTDADLHPDKIRETRLEIGMRMKPGRFTSAVNLGIDLIFRADLRQENKPPSPKKVAEAAAELAENQAMMKAIADDPAGLSKALMSQATKDAFLKQYM